MTEGDTFFKIYRQIFESDIWLNPMELRLFIYLIGKARHSKKPNTKYKNKGIVIRRGQYLRSYRKLQEDLEYMENNAVKQYSLSKIKRTIDNLEKEDRIKTEKTQLGTLFTVVNYCRYQGSRNKKQEHETQSERNRNADGTESEQGWNNTNNDKNVKNDKNIYNIWGEKMGTMLAANKLQILDSYTDELSIDLIEIALDRTLEKADSPGYYNYCKKILDNWVKQGVSCKADIDKLDQEHQKHYGGDSSGSSKTKSESSCKEKDYSKGAPEGFFIN